MEPHDEVEALTGATDHLEYIQEIVDTRSLTDEAERELQKKLNIIQKRLKDKNLYLAVVGGASTGKSTFINALLKEQLLQAGSVSMTTTASSIIKSGSRLEVEVNYYCSQNSEKICKTKAFSASDEPITLGDFPNIHSLTLQELIVSLTTSDQIAKQLDCLSISHPAAFLKEGICIVDTPGADAINEDHIKITRNAVSRADAAIIITPAKQIVSESLIQMINRDLRLSPYLHRCIFLITGMDLIKEEEREKLIKSAYQRLERSLFLEENQTLPPILVSSAQAVIDEFSNEEPIVEDELERQYWQKKFMSLEVELFSYLKRQRALTISEGILRLLTDLFLALESDLNTRWERYTLESTALEAAQIPDLNAFAQQQRLECEEKMILTLDETNTWLVHTITAKREKLIERVEASLAKVDSLEDLKTYADNKLSHLLNKQQSKLQKEVSVYFDGMYQVAQAVNQVFDEQFSEAYQRLNVIQRKKHVDASDYANVSLNAKSLVTTVNSSAALAGPDLGQRMQGAAVAVVASAILLPALIIPAAIIGSIFSGWLGPSLEQRKETFLNDLRGKLLSQFSDLESSLLKEAREYNQQLKEAIHIHIDNHVNRYSQRVSSMKDEQQHSFRKLIEEKEILDKQRRELDRRKNSTYTQMKTLKSISV